MDNHICPLCCWSGEGLYKHFEDKHKHLIVHHPYTKLPDAKKNYEKYMIFKYDVYHFLLQLNYNIIERKLWHCVNLIDNKKYLASFRFNIEYRDDDGKLVKYKTVPKNNKKFGVNKNESIGVKISSLLSEFGDYEKIRFRLYVEKIDIHNFEDDKKVKKLVRLDSKYFSVNSNEMYHEKLLVDEFYKANMEAYRRVFQCEWRVGKFGNMNVTVRMVGDSGEFLIEMKFTTIMDTEVKHRLEKSSSLPNTWILDLKADDSQLEDVIRNRKHYDMNLMILPL